MSNKKNSHGGKREGAGRDPLPRDKHKTRMQIRVSPEERALVARAALIQGVKPTAFYRESAILCAQIIIEDQSPNVHFNRPAKKTTRKPKS